MMRYMQRFGCIGEKCEENCCTHSWVVEIDAATQKRMKQVTSLHSEKERRRWENSLYEVKTYEGRKVTAIRLLPDNSCPLLENGLCHVQATFGAALLSDTCAVYPRRIHNVGDYIELSGMMSCPEMARQLLWHDDACDAVPLDRRTIFRLVLTHGLDPRDIRPYWRLLVKVRSFMIGLLRRPGFTLEQRLFFMTWFAKRTSPILNKSAVKADTAAVLAEMAKLETDDLLRELARRFDAMEASTPVTLALARQLVQSIVKRSTPSYRRLVEKVLAEYRDVRAWLAGDDPPSHASRLNDEYLRRRARVVEREPARVERYFVNLAHNYWMHRLPLEAPDLMVHMLRLLTLMAVLKFLLFSHPEAQGDGELGPRLDDAAVEVVYNTARHIEHGALLNDLENMLGQAQLRSLAGAVLLIRF
jgi:lysine-N-methylase